jgi:hypothetical protein
VGTFGFFLGVSHRGRRHASGDFATFPVISRSPLPGIRAPAVDHLFANKKSLIALGKMVGGGDDIQ